jgi:LAO/AO transport system kinase
VQAIKAGLSECADVFAVNKADREGADATARDLEAMIALGGEVTFGGAHSRGHAAGRLDLAQVALKAAEGRWVPSVHRCVATRNEGLAELLAELEAHRVWLETTEAGKTRHQQRVKAEFEGMLRDTVIGQLMNGLSVELASFVERVTRRELDPYTACEQLIEYFRVR